MIVREYRLILPFTIEEYRIGQLYMVAKASQEETGNASGEGIEIAKNEPYTQNEHGLPPGQFTEKRMYLKSRMPSFIRALVPEAAMVLTEFSWNSYPHCKTVYKNEWLGDKFVFSVESMHTDEPGLEENPLKLEGTDLEKRKIEYLNLACPDSYAPMTKGEDPTSFESTKTGRGKLVPSWFLHTEDPVMCAYKVVRFQFKLYGVQKKVEEWGQFYGMRVPLIQFHRKLFCWMDEWYGLTMKNIRDMEDRTKAITDEKLQSA
eukprot:Plantae.Rhodophyta-Purpureofilum_apyrenoidigerum.ctg950.p1 GENE.Plantae.Rhodophyta-Purpureofilum_apyrenoidigerum.ctg950~~Plantae.Rhodophyta-Purpureofilum_apyrenoidigerum.ctg950.p1  ORF type:complete len:261 (-),score=59.51 Plantae.Rhodophyta-Purpureofilum_apyrenoidigerum.ctg950:353-1135(-)